MSRFVWPQPSAPDTRSNSGPDRTLLHSLNGGPLNGPPVNRSERSVEATILLGRTQVPHETVLFADYLSAVARAPRGMAREFAKHELNKRVLSIGTGSEGGYLVPPGYVDQFVSNPAAVTELYQYCTRVGVGQTTGRIPKEAAGVSVAWGDENTEITASDPSVGNVDYTCERVQAVVKQSRELFEDSNPSIVDVVSGMFARAMAAERDRVVAMGTGSGQPRGLYSASGITDVPGVTSLTYANVVKVLESVDHRYHKNPNFRWFFNQRVKAALMNVLDGNDRPIFVNDATVGFKPMLLGVPVSICNSLPNTFIGIGDLSYYFVFDRGVATLESTTEAGAAFLDHQVWLKYTERWDGKPVIPPTSPFARSKILSGIS